MPTFLRCYSPGWTASASSSHSSWAFTSLGGIRASCHGLILPSPWLYLSNHRSHFLEKKKKSKPNRSSAVWFLPLAPPLSALIVPNVTSKSPFVTRSIFHNPLLTLCSGSFTASATFRYGRSCPLIRPWLRAHPRLGLGLREGSVMEVAAQRRRALGAGLARKHSCSHLIRGKTQCDTWKMLRPEVKKSRILLTCWNDTKGYTVEGKLGQ